MGWWLEDGGAGGALYGEAIANVKSLSLLIAWPVKGTERPVRPEGVGNGETVMK